MNDIRNLRVCRMDAHLLFHYPCSRKQQTRVETELKQFLDAKLKLEGTPRPEYGARASPCETYPLAYRKHAVAFLKRRKGRRAAVIGPYAALSKRWLVGSWEASEKHPNRTFGRAFQRMSHKRIAALGGDVMSLASANVMRLEMDGTVVVDDEDYEYTVQRIGPCYLTRGWRGVCLWYECPGHGGWCWWPLTKCYSSAHCQTCQDPPRIVPFESSEGSIRRAKSLFTATGFPLEPRSWL